MSLSRKLTEQQVKNALAKAKAGKVLTRREEAIIRDFERQTLPELTLEEVAQHFGHTRAAVLLWKRQMLAAGLKWCSIEEITQWREAKAKEATPQELTQLKKQKLEREVKRLDLRIAEDERKLIPVDQVEEQAQTAGAILCSEGKAMIGDLPGQLAGLPEVQIRQRLETRWNQLLANTKARLRAVALGGSMPDLTEG